MQLRLLRIFNIIIVLNISIFNIIKCAIKSLIIMLIYNIFLSINKSLTILLRLFIKINSNFFINSLISNHAHRMNDIKTSFENK